MKACPVRSVEGGVGAPSPSFHRLRFDLTQHGKKKIPDRTSCQTQAGIDHSAPAQRGGHVQDRIRRRQARPGNNRNGP